MPYLLKDQGGNVVGFAEHDQPRTTEQCAENDSRLMSLKNAIGRLRPVPPELTNGMGPVVTRDEINAIKMYLRGERA